MRFDLHTHTDRYSSCGRATPEEMMAAAMEYGLDGIVITEHDVLWSKAEIDELRASFPQLVILRGIEVNTATGEHILVFGITDPALFYPYMDEEVLGQVIEEHGGAAILAHPYRYSNVVPSQTLGMPLHAIEVASSNIRAHMEQPTYELVGQLGLPMAASSDAHWPENVGLYGVEFAGTITDEVQLAQALRAGCFRVFYDKSRVDNLNRQLKEEISLATRLRNQGYSDYEIRDLYGLSLSMLQALAAGRAVDFVTPKTMGPVHL